MLLRTACWRLDAIVDLDSSAAVDALSALYEEALPSVTGSVAVVGAAVGV